MNDGIQKAKQAAAEKAVTYVEEGMLVGLGTGSTAKFAIELIGRKIAQGLKIQGVPTSLETERLAQENRIPLLSDFEQIDLTIDGADEVDERGNLTKGGGGALTREKIVAAASSKLVIIVDRSKLVKQPGVFPLPVEVLPFGCRFVQRQLNRLGCEVRLRTRANEIYITDNRNYILDCFFETIEDPGRLSQAINNIPGVIENGLFVELTDLVIVGDVGGEVNEIKF